MSQTEEHTNGAMFDERKPSSMLEAWWIDHAWDEAHHTVEKMVRYGSRDLVVLGNTIRQMSDRPTLPALQAMELGCLIYLQGKIGRAVENIRQGREIDPDTWFDAAVYAKMAQAARAGAWPVQ